MLRPRTVLLATTVISALSLNPALAETKKPALPNKAPAKASASKPVSNSAAKTSAVKTEAAESAPAATAPKTAEPVTAEPVTAEPVAAEPAAAPETKPLPVVDTKVSSREPEERYVGYGKTHGILGDFPIGPTVQILQVPHPLQVGIEGKYLDIAGFSGMYGMVPKFTVNGVGIKLDAWDVRARWFPFRGAFFLGAAYGQQKLTGTKAQAVSYSAAGQTESVNLEATDEIKTTYISPHLGWRWVTNVGFFYGMEFGWQFAMSSTATVTTNQDSLFEDLVRPNDASAYETYRNLKADIEDKSNKIGKIGLPHVSLIQIGWYF